MALKKIISFARFMELALYGPGGYYQQPRPLGKAGDYFTSVSVGPLFGELLGFQFGQWLAPGMKAGIGILEAGAHDGALARDILCYFHTSRQDIVPALQYCILEPSTERQKWQRETLSAFLPQVTWIQSWRHLPLGTPAQVIFCNELLDAFPVRRLGWDAERHHWFEWGIQLKDDAFLWAKMPVSQTTVWSGFDLDPSPCRSSQLPELFASLPHDFTIEMSPKAERWWAQAAGTLKRGHLVTLDYGLEAADFFTPRFKNGTVRAYRHHHLAASPLADPGNQDITAHVNFSRLKTVGEQSGLQTKCFASQRVWLTEIFARASACPELFPSWTPDRVRQFQTLTHPEHLGDKFRVLVQSRVGHR